jgi:nitrate/nitrite transport system permease protein
MSDVAKTKLAFNNLLLPLIGMSLMVLAWAIVSGMTVNPRTGRPNLPSPARTWDESKLYVLEPFEYRGEMDQGIGRLTLLSLVLVSKGYLLALLIGTPLGFLLGSSQLFKRSFDPIIQVLRPVSPLAWLPLGFLLFKGLKANYEVDVPEMAAMFTVAVCAMWPTVLNTAVGVRAIPQDYHNVARVLNLTGLKKLWKVLLPATLPYMFTGFRLSLGIAWLVIVAAEMLTGKAGLGGFLWQEYNAGKNEHIILCIITVGAVGFLLDLCMRLLEDVVAGRIRPAAKLRELRRRFNVRREGQALAAGEVAHAAA